MDCTIRFTVPLQRAAEARAPTQHERAAHEFEIPEALTGLSVLLVEDNAFNQQVVTEMLSDAGIEVNTASNGLEALRWLNTQRPDVVLMDMHMPRLSGLETLRRIRELPKQPPCILISAAWDSELREAAMQESAFSVLPKPVSPTQLTGVVRDALRTVYNWDPK